VARAVAAEIGDAYGQDDLRAETGISPLAQDAYLRGKHAYDQNTLEGYQLALELFQQAVDSAPDYADAMAGLAGARFMLALQDPPARRQDLEQARAEAEAALAMDSTSLEVRDLYDVIRRSLFQIRRVDARTAGETPTRDLGNRQGQRGSRDSITVNTAVFDTIWVAAMTTMAQRIEEGVRANVIEGSGATGRTTESRLLMAQGRYTEAAQVLERVVAESPDTPQAWDQLMRSYVALNEPTRASDIVGRWSASAAEGAPSADRATQLRSAVELQGMRGYWIWRRDVLTEEQAAGREVSQTELAATYAALGDRNRAYDLLSVALENSESRLLAVPNDPTWDPLRRDQRFRQIEQRIQRARFDRSLRILQATPLPSTLPAPPTAPGN